MYWKVVVSNGRTTRVRYIEALTREDAAAIQRYRMTTPGWDIRSIIQVSQAEYVRNTQPY